MAKIELDKYYTPKDLALYCIQKTYEIIGKESISEIIEPSAGDGAFSNLIKDCIAYDILPQHENIIQANFLELKIGYKKRRLFIGNPPFSYTNSIDKQFYKKCCKEGDYIAFILPIGQYNQNYEFFDFDLIHSEQLPISSYSGVPLKCCFNIYKRSNSGLLNKKPKFEFKDIKLSGIYRRKSRNDKVPSNYDFSICGYGSAIGKICDYENQYCLQFYFIINNLDLKDKIKQIIKDANWKEIIHYASTPSLRQWQIYNYLKQQIPTLE